MTIVTEQPTVSSKPAIRGQHAYQLLALFAAQIADGDGRGARRTLRWLDRVSEESEYDAKFSIFLDALSRQVKSPDRRLGRNLYLTHFEMSQIQLFNIMATRMPLVGMVAAVANRLLSARIESEPSLPVSLIDIGIGHGHQEVSLFRALRERGGAIPPIEVIGIEPSVESLQAAQKNILEAAQLHGLQVTFRPEVGCVEQFSDERWERLRSPGRRLLVNEAFALHHASFGSQRDRDAKQETLDRVRALEPELFVMVEPNSDHTTTDLFERFENAWRHFGTAFAVIDRLDISESEKNAVKVNFFGREIRDILGSTEDSRVERHESADMWTARLRAAGFACANDSLASVARNVECEVIQIALRHEHVSLEYEGKSIVAVLAEEPA